MMPSLSAEASRGVRGGRSPRKVALCNPHGAVKVSSTYPIIPMRSNPRIWLLHLSATLPIDRIWRVLYLQKVALRPNDIAGISLVIAHHSSTNLPMFKKYFAKVSTAPMPRRMTKGPLDVEEYTTLSFQQNFY